MNSININTEGYSAPNGADNLQKNWAAEYAKREVDKHREAEVLDHPDGSVTKNKLSPDVRETIADAKGKSETAKETADNAKVMAQSAKDIADIAKTTADDAVNIATEAVVTAKSEAEYASETARTAKDTAEVAKASADIAVKESENAYEKSLDAHEKASTAENIANTAKNKSEIAEQRAVSAEAKADVVAMTANVAMGTAYDAYRGLDEKANKPSVFTYSYPSHEYEFNYMHNCDIRNGELTTISFTFGNGEYVEDYASGLSFDSGETPTAIDYTDSGILNWVGTDCVTSDGLSIFQPSANTHYDIVFYFNGVQFIGLVNGFVPATGNEAV